MSLRSYSVNSTLVAASSASVMAVFWKRGRGEERDRRSLDMWRMYEVVKRD